MLKTKNIIESPGFSHPKNISFLCYWESRRVISLKIAWRKRFLPWKTFSRIPPTATRWPRRFITVLEYHDRWHPLGGVVTFVLAQTKPRMNWLFSYTIGQGCLSRRVCKRADASSGKWNPCFPSFRYGKLAGNKGAVGAPNPCFKNQWQMGADEIISLENY